MANSSDHVDELRERLQEQGLPKDQPGPTDGPMPPLDGKWLAAHFKTFAGVYNTVSRVYNYTFDAALRDSFTNAETMREDYVIFPAIRKRIRPVCQLDWQLTPVDSSNQRLLDNAQKLTEIMQLIPRFQQMKRCLMEAVFYGRYGVQWKPRWDYSRGDKRMVIDDWTPVYGDKILFRYDGVPCLLVNPTEYKGETFPTPRGLAHALTPAEMELFLWHEFEPEDSDFYRPDMAGAVHGKGYRGTLYWLWWLREKIVAILMDFLEKVGSGVTIFYYEAGNKRSLEEVETAAKEQIGNNVYLFPRNRDGQSAYAGPGIDFKMQSMSGAEFFYQLWDLCNQLMNDAILGEVGSTQAMPSGIGSNLADQHGVTAEERVKYDATDLEHPMQMLVNVLNRWNCPGDPAPRFQFMVDKRNPAAFMEAVKFAFEIGLEIEEDQVRDELSLPAPQPGKKVLSKIQAMQPAAVGAIPAGVPMAAPTGPSAAMPPGQPVQGVPVQQALPAPPQQ